MAIFEFNEIRRESPVFEGNTLIIWIWNADKIPPHLGVSIGKRYFSLTYKGVEDFQTAAMLRKIKRLQIPMAFVGTKIDAEENHVAKLFQSFERAKPGGATCLSPIKELFTSGKDVLQLANLLKELEDSNRISAFYGLNLQPDYSALPEYSWLDIVKRIEQLDAAK
jgi:hypothetical protein